VPAGGVGGVPGGSAAYRVRARLSVLLLLNAFRLSPARTNDARGAGSRATGRSVRPGTKDPAVAVVGGTGIVGAVP
ncbi:hypothetical protein AB4Z54_51125, partial [Streptomyces sp. MCAF7]